MSHQVEHDRVERQGSEVLPEQRGNRYPRDELGPLLMDSGIAVVETVDLLSTSSQKAPAAMQTSPRLKAKRYGINWGGTKRSASQEKTIRDSGKRISLLALLIRSPTVNLLNTD